MARERLRHAYALNGASRCGRRRTPHDPPSPSSAENWSGNPFARSKFIRGKLIYQADPSGGRGGTGAFYSRPFRIDDETVTVPSGDHVRESVPRPLPPDRIKLD